MKSFLLKNKKPICKWGLIPDGVFFVGTLPESYSLAVCPSKGWVVLDVDKHGKMNGFDNIPMSILAELEDTFNYSTKNNGRHYWLKYTGTKELGNKTSGLSIDLRTHKGYVVWYPKEHHPEDCMDKVKETSKEMNKWLEKLFSYVE